MIDTVEFARFDTDLGRGVALAYAYMRGLILPWYTLPVGHYIAMSPCSAAPRGSNARSGSILSAVTRCLLYFAPVLLFINKITDKRITRHGNLFNKEQ